MSVVPTDLGQNRPKTIKMLVQILEKSGLEVDLSLIFMEMKTDRLELQGACRALMKFYEDDSVTDIFDVSGGDMPTRFYPIWIFRPLLTKKSIFGDIVI